MSNPTTVQFLFHIPSEASHLSPEANLTIQMGAISSRQVQNTRTRCVHPDGRAENVAEHSLMLAKVAPELAALLYPELDENLVARYASLHDDVEAYVGDTPTDILSNLDVDGKDALEAQGLAQLTKEFARMPRFADLMQSYEAQSAPEARFVRAVDKLMVLLIHIPNKGEVLRQNYTYETFLRYEAELLERDAYKYGEFTKIMDLRRELGLEVANRFLKDK